MTLSWRPHFVPLSWEMMQYKLFRSNYIIQSQINFLGGFRPSRTKLSCWQHNCQQLRRELINFKTWNNFGFHINDVSLWKRSQHRVLFANDVLCTSFTSSLVPLENANNCNFRLTSLKVALEKELLETQNIFYLNPSMHRSILKKCF